MRRRNLFFPAASTFMLFLLASCSTAPPAGPAAKPAGQGSVGEAGFIGYKCKAAANWLEQLHQQYPAIALPPASSYLPMPQIGNLFRDSYFVPVFGFAYTQENSARVAALNDDVIARCIAGGKDIAGYDERILDSHRPLFEQTFARFNSGLALLAKDYGRREEWMNNAFTDLETLPPDAAGLQKLELDIATPGRSLLLPLWPREQQMFMNAVSEKRKDITDRIAGLPRALPVQSAPAPLQRTAPAQLPPPPQPPQTVGQRVAERRFEMVEIPLSMQGRQQSTDWIIAFDREFAAYNDNPEVITARQAWLLSREEIFKATKGDFMAKLAKLPTGPGSEEAHAQLLMETFPLRADQTMAVYKDYRAETIMRQKPFARRTFEKTMDSILSVGSWLSEAARRAVRGEPQK